MDFLTSAADTDIAIKLVDHYPPSTDHPDGFAMNLCDTVVRLSSLHGVSVVESGDDHRVVHVRVELPPIANRFSPGHRIRVDVTSSNFPRVDVNPNSSGSAGGNAATIATNGVRTGGTRGTSIDVPVLLVGPLAPVRVVDAAQVPAGGRPL